MHSSRKSRYSYFCKSLFLLLANVFADVAFSQSGVLLDIEKNYQEYAAGTVKEKMFVHTDKGFYLAGEIIWFKLYNVDEGAHQLLPLSKVAYIDVLDADNKFVLQAKVELVNGMGSGSFYLPFTLQTGGYKLRAYTNWMKNFGAGYFFEKGITVVNTLRSADLSVEDTAATYAIHFYPEGGNLVNGLESKLAFKAVDKKGKGINFEGILINNTNDTITRFQPGKFGMGNLVLTPQQNQQYKAIVTLDDGKVIQQNLPVAYNEGFTMQLSRQGENQIKVTIHKNVVADYIYLIASNCQQLRFAERTTFNNNTAVFYIDKQKLGDGIAYLTLLNNQRQPVCERLFFTPPEEIMQIDAASDATAYDTRKNVSISFSTPSQTGKTLSSNLSMSVYGIDSLQLPDDYNIVNYLWLTSQLSGTIESPEYYIKTKGAEADEASDNLMLTHGWRRFDWERNILIGKKPVFSFLPEYKGHIMTGIVKQVGNNKPAASVPAFLSSPVKGINFYSSTSSKEGIIQFDVKNYYGQNQVVLQSNTANENLYFFEIFSPFSESYTSNEVPHLNLSENEAADLLNHSIGMQVQHVFAKDSMHAFYLPPVDSMPFYGSADYKYKFDDYTRFTTMEEVLREYVREINVRRRNNQYQMIIYNGPQKTFFEDNSLILLDGVPVFDQSKLFTYDPLKIQKLEVLTSRYFLGNFIFNGIASFTTYKQNFEGLQLGPNTMIMDYEGLQQQRHFYAHEYHTSEQKLSRIPDFRNVLYWAPDIRYNGTGKGEINFFTSDRKGRYRVVLQGINEAGKAGATSFIIEVK